MALLSGGCGASAAGGVKVYDNSKSGVTDIGYAGVHMPAFPRLGSRYWFNASPDLVNHLKGKVVLVDFWDYTCVNCIRTFPYLKEWYRRYSKDGLVIIGVHSPEFQFAQKRKNVAQAIKKFGLKYPVVMDNDFRIWKIFGNQYWPQEYLFDKNGLLRYAHSGEGEYGNTESMIQKLLKELNPEVKLPPLMKPVRAVDEPGAVCYLPTAESYLGYRRGRIGNRGGYVNDEAAEYFRPKVIKKGFFYLVGRWETRRQYVRYSGRQGETGTILLNYHASQVNIVVRADRNGIPRSHARAGVRLYIYQDGMPIPKGERPQDLRVGPQGKTFILVKEPGMYTVVDNRKFGRHILSLETSADGLAAYSFTFGTSCAKPPGP